jgi:hypothetical protein
VAKHCAGTRQRDKAGIGERGLDRWRQTGQVHHILGVGSGDGECECQRGREMDHPEDYMAHRESLVIVVWLRALNGIEL